MLGAIADGAAFPDIISKYRTFGKLWFNHPNDGDTSPAMDAGALVQLVGWICIERSRLSKLASDPKWHNRERVGPVDEITNLLARFPVINPAVAIRTAGKWAAQSGHTVKTIDLPERRTVAHFRYRGFCPYSA